MGTNFDYYKKNLKELYEKYPNRFIVLKECEVVADFSDFEEAYDWAFKKYGIGNFLIQECVEQKPIYLRNVFRPELKGKRYVKTERGFCLVNVEKEEGNVWGDSL